MKHIIKYGLLVLNNGRFLVNRKLGTKLFLLPGGKPEKGETPEDCLVRELLEEHNVGVVMESIRFISEFEDKAANEPDTIIQIMLYEGKIIGEPKPGMEIEEQRWFGKDSDQAMLSPIIKHKILPFIRKLL
jgi:8-oxo-dGTP pyrophosphatase MutT (NUDIX family)